MKRILCIILTVLITTTVLSGCGSNEKSNNSSVESDISSIYNSNEQMTSSLESDTSSNKLTVQDVKNCIKVELKNYGYTDTVFTNETTKTEGDKITTTFKYLNGNITVSVIENSSGIEQILAWASPSSFVAQGMSASDAIVLSAIFSMMPLVSCYDGVDSKTLYTNIISTTAKGDDTSLQYEYVKDDYTYLLLITDTLVTAAVKVG